MKKVFLILVLLVMSNSIFSQRDTFALPKIWVKTNPLHYLDGYNGPNANLSIESVFSQSLGINLTFGYIFDSPFNFTTNHSGYILRGEVKKYFSKDDDVHLFGSIEFSYSDQSFTRTDRIEYTERYHDTLFERTYDSKRKYIGPTVIFGFNQVNKSGFILEFMAGFGLRYNMVTNDLTDEDSEHRVLGDWTVPTNYLIKKGNHIIPRFQLGIKVGWRIGK